MSKDLIKKENSVSKKESTSLQVYDLKPLLYRPDLKVSDVLSTNGISDEHKLIILASLNETKLKFIDLIEDKKSWNSLKDILVKTIWSSGINMSKEDQKIFIPLAIEDIKNEFPMLTVSDVGIAFKNGVRRKYGKNDGEFYGISITTINFWLKKYSEETKIEAMLKLPLIKPMEEEKIYTEEEKLENHRIWIEGVYNEFEKYKNTGIYSFYDFNSAFYQYAKEIGLINLTEEHKVTIHDKAILEYKMSKNLKNARSIGQRADFKHAIENLKKEDVKSHKDEISLICKKIAVNELFKALAEKDKDLKTIVEKLAKRKKETNQ